MYEMAKSLVSEMGIIYTNVRGKVILLDEQHYLI